MGSVQKVRRIHLLRHAMPDADAESTPSEWALTPSGRDAARALGSRLPQGVAVLSSAERKAIESARCATGREPLIDPRFGEVRRPGEPFDADARERRGAWVRGETDARHECWESMSEAARRFAAGVADQGAGDDLLIATHGMVMVAWLVSIGQVDAGPAAEEYWASLAFPDLVTLTESPAPLPGPRRGRGPRAR